MEDVKWMMEFKNHHPFLFTDHRATIDENRDQH
jgi:hypothetical protein